MTKHIATYLLPGSFFPEEVTKELDARSPMLAASLAPERAFCFTLHELPDEVPEVEGYTLMPKPVSKSGRYYLGGTCYNIEDMESMGMDTMVWNMEANDWPLVIQARFGNWQPFLEGDTLLAV